MLVLEESTRPLTAGLPAPSAPITRVDAPAGGSAWVVADPDLAREVLAHPDIAKDPALAPPGWTPATAGLEPTAAERASLTTLDGPRHAALRKAFAPFFGTARMREAYPRMRAIARELLAALPSEVDLVADFTTRYPLRVVGDLLGVPADRTDAAIAACALMTVDYPRHVGAAMGAFAGLAAAAHDGLADRLEARLPAGADLHYQVFTLLFAGQLTTDPTVGVLVARLLGEPDPPADLADLVDDTLRRYPAAPFSLWRFTTAPTTLAGENLPAHAPVLVDLRATDLPFGAGPHYCIGAALARLELEALAEVLRTDFPQARLAVPFESLRYTRPAGIMGGRLESLPLHMPR
jgi:cytochrome P450